MGRQSAQILLLAVLLGAALGCGVGTGGPLPTPTPPPQAASPTASQAVSTPEPTGTRALDPARLLERAGAAAMVQLTPTEGAGLHPRFEWQPVEGAARYALLLMDADGKAYWAWAGAETAVYLGGGSEPPQEDSVGPALLRPGKWIVQAFSAEGAVIGSSPIRPIAP